jgi:hypothetical protein
MWQARVDDPVIRGDELAIGVAPHPDRPLAQLGQPVQGLCRHRPGGNVAVEHDGVDTSRVDVLKGSLERGQVAVDVSQDRDPHQGPPLDCASTILAHTAAESTSSRPSD